MLSQLCLLITSLLASTEDKKNDITTFLPNWRKVSLQQIDVRNNVTPKVEKKEDLVPQKVLNIFGSMVNKK